MYITCAEFQIFGEYLVRTSRITRDDEVEEIISKVG